MAAGVLQAPGTEYGPCELRGDRSCKSAEDRVAQATCGHRDCAQTRRMAAAPCSRCSEPIGFGVRFYNLGGAVNDGAEELVHARCEEEAHDV